MLTRLGDMPYLSEGRTLTMVEQTSIEPQLPPEHTAVTRLLNRSLALATDSTAFAREALGELRRLLDLAVAHMLLLDQDGDELMFFASTDAGPPHDELALRSLPEVIAALLARQTILIE